MFSEKLSWQKIASSANPMIMIRFVEQEFIQRRAPILFETVARFAGIAWHFRQHLQMVRAINGPHTKAVLAKHPRLAYKYTASYLSYNFKRSSRREMLVGHYRFLNERLNGSFFPRALNHCLTLWQQQDSDHHFSVTVEGPCEKTRHPEGDLTFVFNMDDAPLYKVSFCIIPSRSLTALGYVLDHPTDHAMFIGRVQGIPTNFHLIREATKSCHEVAPPDMLMAALAGAASALGITTIAGVGMENSIALRDHIHSEKSFDYTEFWGRYSSTRSPDGNHIMTIPFPEKAITLIASKHRKRTLVKREYKKQIAACVEAAVGTMAVERNAPPQGRQAARTSAFTFEESLPAEAGG